MIIREIKFANSSEVPIVDIEIKNNISVPTGEWKYQESDIICCAILYGEKIIVLLREEKDDINSYKDILKEHLDKLPTMYAFNFKMEKYGFLGFLGKSYFIEEIKSFKGRGWSKQKFYEELVKDKKISSMNVPKDPLEHDSGEVLERYKKKDYESIINHNVVDVIKQYYVWKNKHYFLQKYKNKINTQGWFQE